MSKREAYRNGDPITLQWCGCDGCKPSMINGVLCHETSCPEAWRDYAVECFECGCDFYRENRFDRTCPDCVNRELCKNDFVDDEGGDE